ncbi:unnamed protein product [Paramecium octaurelia]|uniref:Uncharacterized protein n=1 Tax=Paramecium octaurelia TaxID=43137 RepID=A0A8S1YC94_PAROT|nr:unnamed protein product [Paramecium octaurelia]
MEVFHLKIIAIQDSTNQVLQYCLYFSNLKLMNIYSLHGYKIIQPLKYSVSQSYLGILTTKNNSKYLMLFLFLYIPDVQLKQVIKVSNDQWFYINDNIFYHDEQGDLSVINMHYFNISCQLNQNNYSEFFQYNSINLELKSEIDNSTIGLKQLQILILNQCQKLQPKQAKLFLLSHSNNTLSIHLAQYFYGAVDTLYLNGQCDAKLKGPFLVKYQIDECKSEIIDEEICLKYDKLQLEPDRNSQIINSLVFNFGFNQVKLSQLFSPNFNNQARFGINYI